MHAHTLQSRHVESSHQHTTSTSWVKVNMHGYWTISLALQAMPSQTMPRWSAFPLPDWTLKVVLRRTVSRVRSKCTWLPPRRLRWRLLCMLAYLANKTDSDAKKLVYTPSELWAVVGGRGSVICYLFSVAILFKSQMVASFTLSILSSHLHFSSNKR